MLPGLVQLKLDRRCAPCGASWEEEEELWQRFQREVAARKPAMMAQLDADNLRRATARRDEELAEAHARIERIQQEYLETLEWGRQRGEQLWREQEVIMWQQFRDEFLGKP